VKPSLQLHISLSTTTGEGEHKIARHMNQSSKNPNHSHLIVSPDSDMILLGVTSMLPNVFICHRVETGMQKYTVTSPDTWMVTSLNCIPEFMFAQTGGRPTASTKEDEFLAKMDFAYACILAGNDYLSKAGAAVEGNINAYARMQRAHKNGQIKNAATSPPGLHLFKLMIHRRRRRRRTPMVALLSQTDSVSLNRKESSPTMLTRKPPKLTLRSQRKSKSQDRKESSSSVITDVSPKLTLRSRASPKSQPRSRTSSATIRRNPPKLVSILMFDLDILATYLQRIRMEDGDSVEEVTPLSLGAVHQVLLGQLYVLNSYLVGRMLDFRITFQGKCHPHKMATFLRELSPPQRVKLQHRLCMELARMRIRSPRGFAPLPCLMSVLPPKHQAYLPAVLHPVHSDPGLQKQLSSPKKALTALRRIRTKTNALRSSIPDSWHSRLLWKSSGHHTCGV
jgi:hypothetical protein